MAQSNASSIQGAAIRVTRLTSTGTTATGASASYVLNTFIRVSFTPEYEEGEEIIEKGANGLICTTFKTNDTLKRVNLELAICEPDPEFTELTSGGTLFSSGGLSVGWAAPIVGVDPTPNGVAIEVWSKAIANGTLATTGPYFRWVFPYAQIHPTGERVIENGLMANTFEGYAVGNTGFGDGPQNDWTFTSAAAWQYARSAASTVPGTNGYQTGLA